MGIWTKSKQAKHEEKLQDKQNQANLELHQMDNNFNERMAEKANQWNVDQWNREVAQQNLNWERDAEYNSASAQVERYREAGLNPTIMMQGQGASSSSSQSVPHASSATASAAGAIPMGKANGVYPDYNQVFGNLQSSVRGFQDSLLQVEQIQSLKIENQRKQQQMLYDLEEAKGRAHSSSSKARLDKIEADLAEQTFYDSVDTSKFNKASAQYLSEERKYVAMQQKAIAEGIDERLAAELAKLKFDSSLPFERYIDAVRKSGVFDVIGALKSLAGFLGLNTQALIHYFQNKEDYKKRGLAPQFTGFREVN